MKLDTRSIALFMFALLTTLFSAGCIGAAEDTSACDTLELAAEEQPLDEDGDPCSSQDDSAPLMETEAATEPEPPPPAGCINRSCGEI